MKWLRVIGLPVLLLVAGCDSVEDRAVTEYQECAAEYGFEVTMIGIVRGPDGRFATTAPDLPEPAASACLRRASRVLQGE